MDRWRILQRNRYSPNERVKIRASRGQYRREEGVTRMTKTEKIYLMKLVEDNKRKIQQIESGELWANIYKTHEQKLAVIQGIHMANEPLECLLGID